MKKINNLLLIISFLQIEPARAVLPGETGEMSSPSPTRAHSLTPFHSHSPAQSEAESAVLALPLTTLHEALPDIDPIDLRRLLVTLLELKSRGSSVSSHLATALFWSYPFFLSNYHFKDHFWPVLETVSDLLPDESSNTLFFARQMVGSLLTVPFTEVDLCKTILKKIGLLARTTPEEYYPPLATMTSWFEHATNSAKGELLEYLALLRDRFEASSLRLMVHFFETQLPDNHYVTKLLVLDDILASSLTIFVEIQSYIEEMNQPAFSWNAQTQLFLLFNDLAQRGTPEQLMWSIQKTKDLLHVYRDGALEFEVLEKIWSLWPSQSEGGENLWWPLYETYGTPLVRLDSRLEMLNQLKILAARKNPRLANIRPIIRPDMTQDQVVNSMAQAQRALLNSPQTLRRFQADRENVQTTALFSSAKNFLKLLYQECPVARADFLWSPRLVDKLHTLLPSEDYSHLYRIPRGDKNLIERGARHGRSIFENLQRVLTNPVTEAYHSFQHNETYLNVKHELGWPSHIHRIMTRGVLFRVWTFITEEPSLTSSERLELTEKLACALAQCIELDGHMICPHGKIQRLIRVVSGYKNFPSCDSVEDASVNDRLAYLSKQLFHESTLRVSSEEAERVIAEADRHFPRVAPEQKTPLDIINEKNWNEGLSVLRTLL